MAPSLSWTSTSSSSSGEPAVDSPYPRRFSDEAGPSRPSMVGHFVAMGFPEVLVVKAVRNNEEGNENAVLQTLLNTRRNGGDGGSSLDWDDDDEDGMGEVASSGHMTQTEEVVDCTKRDGKLATLLEMGYPIGVASLALKRCGDDASILDLTDFIYAAEITEKTDLPVSPIASPTEAESCIPDCHIGNKRRRSEENI